jgi:hypothetical protein
MRPALDPTGHRVPRTKPTCLLHTWRPHRQRPFALVLHLHHHESSRNLHLQYLAKNQYTQHCQSLITQGSDHPPVLEPHMVHRFLRRREPILGLARLDPTEGGRLRHCRPFSGSSTAESPVPGPARADPAEGGCLHHREPVLRPPPPGAMLGSGRRCAPRIGHW